MKGIASHSLSVAHLSEGYMLAGRMEEATQLAERALRLTRDRKERGHEGWVLRLLGEISSHRDPSDAEAAEHRYRQALVLADELGMRPLTAQCQLGLGKLYRRVGKHEQAREHLTTALTLYREMDMPFWLEQAEAEAKHLG